ncbi:MAG TPA: CaiB/BaiF CoA-transferase family protein [Ramlibacter sp.]|nr:CaiB/BaiF CoA-transferase family protein [Ramlibacter sp.]
MVEAPKTGVKGPLSHITVLDLSRSLAGPWACQIFSDFGATVIKVERPGAGDEARAWGPPFLKDATGASTGDSPYFLMSNRGKKSITLDISKPQAQEIVRALARKADVLVENYKVGGLAAYGLAYDDLKADNPGLVYCSVTGFGQSGPRSGQAAYDFAIQAMSGLMSITGEVDGRPGAGPQKVGVPIIDIVTGLYAAIGALVGLVQRGQTSRGDYIDLALLDAAIAGISSRVMSYLLSGVTPTRQGNRHATIQPQDVFDCADGQIALAVGNDGQFAKFCHVLERPDLARDARFATNGARLVHIEELLPLLRPLLAAWNKQQLADALDAAGVPCSAINNIAEVLLDPQVVHRGVVAPAPHARAGEVPQVVNPLKFKGSVGLPLRAHAALGEHTDEVLRELGYSDERIAELRRQAVI